MGFDYIKTNVLYAREYRNECMSDFRPKVL
jgi:hypothetical protein